MGIELYATVSNVFLYHSEWIAKKRKLLDTHYSYHIYQLNSTISRLGSSYRTSQAIRPKPQHLRTWSVGWIIVTPPMACGFLANSARIYSLAVKINFCLFALLFSTFHSMPYRQPVFLFGIFSKFPFSQPSFVLRFAII